MEALLILFIALAIDLVTGEPHRFIHPVVWMGKLISIAERRAIRRSHPSQFIYGLIMTLVITGLFTAGAFFLLFYLRSVHTALYIIAGAWLLKSTFSLKELRKTALRFRDYLANKKTGEARNELRSLVSRDTSELAEPQLVSAAVESVAESSSDSFVAPLFYFLLLGIPGAIAYRAVNTLDSMIGYHGEYEYRGKFAARLDDVLNFIPARITALLLVLASLITGRGARPAWQTALKEHSRTESPNAGWPMAAVAGALGVQLEKKGHYKLGKAGNPLTTAAIDGSLRLAQVAALTWTIICLATGGIRFALTA